MAVHECPRCGSTKATTVMLPPAKGSPDARPHPAFRCMVCDTQWADDEQWAQLRESRDSAAGSEREPDARSEAQA